jgi:hypothetical protein
VALVERRADDGRAGWQVPDWQVSLCVQPLPSLQEVPFGRSGFEQTPVPVLHVPRRGTESSACRRRVAADARPAWQVSVCVQALPSLQPPPFAMMDTVVCPAGPAAHPPVVAVTK